MAKSNGSAAETTAQIDTIAYDAAVREGKEIVLEIEAAERGQLRLGELADRLEPKYKDRTLAKFAAEIGVSKCTVDRYRTVYRAWAGKLAPGPNLVPQYAVLRELATHPEREQIISKNPNITKREAHDKMRALKRNEKEKAEEAQEEDWAKHTRRWLKELAIIANDVIRAAGVGLQCATPEQRAKLARAVDQSLVDNVRGAGDVLAKLANHLEELLEAAEETEQPHVKTSAPIEHVHGAAHVAA